MDSLWKKEPHSELYVDLFADAPIEFYTDFEKIKKNFDENKKHHFLEKNDEKSVEFRNLGNDYYKKKDWEKALKCYTKSLCFAKKGSENVSLAYANRSSCFLHLNMYSKCLIDIGLATQANYPKHLMAKLSKRQNDCLDLIKNGAPDRSESPSLSLSYPAHSKFPGMANVLGVKQNEEFGRFIVAKRDIPAGKVVLAEKSFSSKSYDLDRCHTCLKVGANFVPCEHCVWGLFCHDTCAENHLHQLVCGQSLIGMRDLERIESKGVSSFLDSENGKTSSGEIYETVEFLSQSVLGLSKMFPNAQSLIDFVEDAVQSEANEVPSRLDDMESKYRGLLQLNKLRKSLSYQQTYITYKLLLLNKGVAQWFNTEERRRFLMHLVYHHHCVVWPTHGQMNAFILFTYLNHACASNLRTINIANMRFGVTLRPIKKGEQLFISYLADDFGDIPVEETQQKIFDGFGFRCNNCERCKPDEELSEENVKMLQNDPDNRFVFMRAIELEQSTDVRGKNEQRKLLKEKVVGMLNRYGSKHWCKELAQLMRFYDGFMFDPEVK